MSECQLHDECSSITVVSSWSLTTSRTWNSLPNVFACRERQVFVAEVVAIEANPAAQR